MKTALAERRLKMAIVPSSLLVRALTGPAHVFSLDLPPDVEPTSISWSEPHQGFVIFFAHESFHPVPEDGVVPMIGAVTVEEPPANLTYQHGVNYAARYLKASIDQLCDQMKADLSLAPLQDTILRA